MKRPLPFPFGGLSDDMSFGHQPNGTTRNAQNVRGIDNPTGRTRGGVRSGTLRLSATPVNGADVPPRRGGSLIYDSRKVAYTGITPDSTNDEVKFNLERRKPCYGGAIDSQSNVFVVDGNATVTKYNATGTLSWSVALPVPDERYTSRCITVDEAGFVYVGISTGGQEAEARLFALIPRDDTKAEVYWEVETGAFVEDMVAYKGRLITLQNKTSTGESWVVAYDGPTTLAPAEAFRSKAPAPANSIAVGPTGTICVVANATQPLTRGRDPRSTIAGRITEDWKLRDLIDFNTRIWSEFDPQSLLDLQLGNADDITVWPDSSGNGRDLFQKPGAGAPTMILNSMGRLPAAFFEGTVGVASPPVLVSAPNAATSTAFADQQRTLLPAYKDEASAAGYTNNAQLVLFFLLRPRRELTTAGKGMGFFRQYFNGESGASGRAHHLAFNTQSNVLRLDTATSTAGFVRWHSSAGDGTATALLNASGTGGSIAAVNPAITASGAVLVTVVLNYGGAGAAADHPSQLRVNGTVIDEWDMSDTPHTVSYLADTILNSELGSIDFGQAANFDGFEGTMHYSAVLNRYTSYTNSAPIKYPFTQNAGTATFAPDTTGDSEIERVEGWIAHRFGVGHILAAAHPFSDAKGTPNRQGIASHSQPWLLNSNFQVLAKYAPSGELKWVATSYAAYRAFAAQTIGGLGYGVAIDADSGIYTMGPHALSAAGAPANDYTQLRKIIDNGDTFTHTANVTGATAGGGTPTSAASAWGKTYNDYTEQVGVANLDIDTAYQYPRMHCDTLRNVCFPWSSTTGTFSGVALIAYDKTGGNGLAPVRALTGNNGLGLAFSQNGNVAIPDPNVPVFDATTISGSNQNALPRAEFVWIFTDLGSGGTTTNPTVHKVRLLTVAATTGSPRTQVVLTVAGGAIKKGTSAITAPAGSGTLAQPELSATSQWIDMAVAFGEAFFTDRSVYRVYRPKTDVVAEYKATKGVIPPRFAFMEFWRGRMVIARGADDGHQWNMSKQGDVYDWDTGPPVPSSIQAIGGTSSGRIGRCPDIINTIKAISDDVLFIGCDHSIWTLTGDPQSGGEFDQRSDTIGAVYGRGACTDPEGNIYWLGTLGGIFRMTPNGLIEPLTLRSIERRLEAADLANYHIHLEWDFEDKGLRVFQLAYAPAALAVPYVVVKAWFWDQKNSAWWEDQYGVTANKIQPTCVFTIDGDAPDDRRLVYGCEDGFLRYRSRTARNDDATAAGATVAIASLVDIGPVWPAESGGQGRITEVLAELSSTQGHATMDLFASDVADDMGTARASFIASPGRNHQRKVRAKGSYAWVRVRAASPNNRWAVEQIEITAHPAGMHRLST